MRKSIRQAITLCCIGVCALILCIPSAQAQFGTRGETEIWRDGVGSGFHKDQFNVGFGAGALLGMKALGSKEAHDLALGLLEFGWVFTDVLGEGHWYSGNFELRGELFGGAQYDPNSRYFIGFTPLVRYSFATGTRWVPFIEGGAGVSGANIGAPDLAGRFQFNIQGGLGTYYFFQENKAISLRYRFLHFSNAKIERPNRGIESMGVIIALTWFL